jgi:hypothetical protein
MCSVCCNMLQHFCLKIWLGYWENTIELCAVATFPIMIEPEFDLDRSKKLDLQDWKSNQV